MPRVTSEEVQSLVASGSFDAAWYLKEYPDVAMTGLTPEEHYLWIGRALNRKGCEADLPSPSQPNWGVITTRHTLFLAKMVASNLRRHGWKAEVLLEPPHHFHHDFYMVLCPQMFERLPPGERMICYQLEQSVSSRWFTPKYFNLLENCSAVLDYSMTNLEFLEKNGIVYPHVFYLPVGACDDQLCANDYEKKYDLLFYGDYKSCPRRRRFIESLAPKYNLKVVDEVFGDEVHRLIRESRFVLNLHYYESALLELPRIQESLSLGTPVISEATLDSAGYPSLNGAVTFFEEGSVEDMRKVVARALKKGSDPDQIRRSVVASQREFRFMFDRFLMAKDFLPVWKLDEIQVPEIFDARMISVSLPETVRRRRIFEAEQIADCAIFDGMRKSPGWIGCGMSYKVLCIEALRRGKQRLAVIEDDVEIDSQFETNLLAVMTYLKRIEGEWDIFCGVIASLHDDVVISKVETFGGIDFVTIDKMTSMVFNIYNERALQLISKWSPLNVNVETNAIDRYLEHTNLKVVVAHPYIAGHRAELHSTLWNFQNSEYVDMIQESEDRLGRLKAAWIARNPTALVA